MTAPLFRPIANRAVHLRILPRPANLAESREMMRLIAQFGEVEYFKNLKYDRLSGPNSAMVVFREEEAAQRCVRQGGMRFRLERRDGEDGRRETGEWAARSERELQAAKGEKGAEEVEVEMEVGVEAEGKRVFHVRANPARAHFRDQINASRFHGAFQVDTKSAAQQDLVLRVPVLGLSDIGWNAEGKPWRVAQREKEREYTGRTRRKGLQEVWRDGQGVKGEGGQTLAGLRRWWRNV